MYLCGWSLQLCSLIFCIVCSVVNIICYCPLRLHTFWFSWYQRYHAIPPHRRRVLPRYWSYRMYISVSWMVSTRTELCPTCWIITKCEKRLPSDMSHINNVLWRALMFILFVCTHTEHKQSLTLFHFSSAGFESYVRCSNRS